MKTRTILTILALIILASAAANAQKRGPVRSAARQVVPVPAFEANGTLKAERIAVLKGFKVPECVVVNPKTGVPFVANIECKEEEYWVDDGEGFISKLTRENTIQKLRWRNSAKGAVLNAPKGMAILNGTLWVTDNHRLVGFGLGKRAKHTVIDIPNAQNVNDLATDGAILYATDTGVGTIYKIDPKKGVVGTIKAPEAVNGVTAWKGKIFAVSWELHDVYELDPKGKKEPKAFGLASHFTNLDGIELLPDGTIIVSDFMGNKVSTIAPDHKTVRTLIETDTPADIGINRKKKLLYVPNFKHDTVEIYKLK